MSGTGAAEPAVLVGTPQAPDTCPRCGGGFACGVAGSAPCACTTVQLTPQLLASLRVRWQRCLCLRCLQALAAGETV